MFCTKCGSQLPEDAYFCPKCGYRTQGGKEAGVLIPVDELREAFHKIGQQMEKAMQTTAEQVQEAFKTAKENIHSSTGTKSVMCSNCGQRNAKDSAYCCNCGKKLK